MTIYSYGTSFILSIILFMSACTSSPVQNNIQLQWDTLPPLPDIGGKANPGVAGAFSGTSKNRLIVAGGANFPGKPAWDDGIKKYWNIIYVLPLNGDNNEWEEEAYHLPFPVAYGASVQLDNGILLVGGKNDSGYLSSVMLLQWKEDSVFIKTFPDLPAPLSGLAAARIENNIYVCGGENANGKQATFYKLNVKQLAAGWVRLPDLPQGPLSNAVLVPQSDGQQLSLYLIGGRTTADTGTVFYSSNWKFNPVKNKWFQQQPVQDSAQRPVALAAGTAIAAGKHAILLFGGDDGILFNALAGLQRRAAREKDPVKRRYWDKKHDSLFIHHPGFNRQVLLYHTVDDSWTTLSPLPFPTQVTTHCFRYKGEIIIPSGEIRPGIRTPAVRKARPSF